MGRALTKDEFTWMLTRELRRRKVKKAKEKMKDINEYEKELCDFNRLGRGRFKLHKGKVRYGEY